MVNKDFYEELKAAIRMQLPEDLKKDMVIEIQEVTKNNDIKLHGLVIRHSDENVAPTIYLEEFLGEMDKNASIGDIARYALNLYAQSMFYEKPHIEDISLEYEDIKERLTVQLADADLNRERLKDVVYKPVGNGLVMIPYAVVNEDNNGSMSFSIRKDMARDKGYNLDELFDIALSNTMKRYEPMIGSMESILFGGTGMSPYREDFCLDKSGMYVVSNDNTHLGAVAFFYPEVQERIGRALGENYYAIPSSVHEWILVPENAGITYDNLVDMLKNANEDVVSPRDILSDKILKFDIEKNRLVNPAEQDKQRPERSSR